MDSRPVFVLISAETCPACIKFKAKTWPALKDQLIKDGKVKVEEITLDQTTSRPDPVKYHKSLYKYIGWFPTIILFPAENWNNHDIPLQGVIKNGKLTPNGVDMVGEINFSKADILKWVDASLKHDIFHSKSQDQHQKHQKHQKPKIVIVGDKMTVPTAGSIKFGHSYIE